MFTTGLLGTLLHAPSPELRLIKLPPSEALSASVKQGKGEKVEIWTPTFKAQPEVTLYTSTQTFIEWLYLISRGQGSEVLLCAWRCGELEIFVKQP